MTQGETEKEIRRQAKMHNMPLPESILKAPILNPSLIFYWEAFVHLSTCRSVGMAEGPIPWLAIHEYANRFSLDSDSFDRLLKIISAMDREYLKLKEKEYKKKSK